MTLSAILVLALALCRADFVPPGNGSAPPPNASSFAPAQVQEEAFRSAGIDGDLARMDAEQVYRDILFRRAQEANDSGELRRRYYWMTAHQAEALLREAHRVRREARPGESAAVISGPAPSCSAASADQR